MGITGAKGESERISVTNTNFIMPESSRTASGVPADAQHTMQELDQLLERTLTVDNRLDWASLVMVEPFKSSLPKRPFVIYDENDTPVDIEYLTMVDPKPSEPRLLPRPSADDFTAHVGIIDKMLFRSNRLEKDAEDAYISALTLWDTRMEQTYVQYDEALQLWSDNANSIDKENEQRNRLCIEDQKQWHAEKLEHKQNTQTVSEKVAAFKAAYESKQRSAVEQYCYEVLSRSTYPDYFPDDVAVSYQADRGTLNVMIKLIHPDDLPIVGSVSYVKSRDEIKTKELSQTARNTLYANVVRSIAIRTLHEIIESDTADAINDVVVNGYVDTVDLATGHDQESVIVSVCSTKKHFLDLRLDRVDAASCFEGLGGRGTVRGISELTPVSPIDVSGLVGS